MNKDSYGNQIALHGATQVIGHVALKAVFKDSYNDNKKDIYFWGVCIIISLLTTYGISKL
ncbi:hypothetical protein [Acidithiobacillus concretivorus]|uniref:Uncharacterized protein n=1 Tax=Acidithiobacillus concretivorus TaxID=3063952 RepID=A0ABS5ZTP7_9PROT|nr:hypothetical protein [Acidithiobacillus concretivorus]MBU2740018.1 hypothetical protein [Acidithiobacillus concretivorus]